MPIIWFWRYNFELRACLALTLPTEICPCPLKYSQSNPKLIVSFPLSVLWIEPGALGMLADCSTNELQPQGFFLLGQSDSLEKNFLNSSFKWSLSILRAQGKRTRCLHAAHPHFLLTVCGAISSEPVVPCSIIRRWTIYSWGRGKLLLGCMENGGWHRSTCFWTHFYPVLIYLLISTQSSSPSIFLFFKKYF